MRICELYCHLDQTTVQQRMHSCVSPGSMCGYKRQEHAKQHTDIKNISLLTQKVVETALDSSV